ncbi:nicotinamide mononucleotide transporter [Dysgonomonas sp. Marseille-P4677]|uniref:nicotinamide riboside transporter PnuC n=1 Tax=Dysgonomonas sp. Marseille-P4677 TaxID=2364790 RepID=UPI00191408AD|nr:nicotinamide riboside transporter PnuC [Dysgonomonas sp. Marseille-P4677]MBK5721480.1 nicotinamide mononucleotide transporter [Dysgonomonas sp. Marseille-P4677]
MDIILSFIESNWVSIVGAFIGLLFLYLEYKANVWMWAASVVMAAFYIYIFYKTELYASMSIYIYFFLASIYGWIVWVMRNRDKKTGDEIITHVQNSYILPIIFAIIVISGLIYYMLVWLNGNVFFITIGDAVTTSLNIVALWMISRKWAEQWLLVIPANLISAILLFAQHDIMSGCLFLIFFIVSIFGYINWKKMVVIA